ncbi:MAG: SGNH/GDSL hydrolase family protein [Kiritimatiellia bacterium]|nr:GDSL-type esterase/lipase family protein [Lentisphaerota bacterium]
MNLDNVEFFNVGAQETIPGLGKHGLTRIPRNIREKLNARARIMGQDAAGCEVRFVSDAPLVDLHLAGIRHDDGDETLQVRILRGNHLMRTVQLQPGRQHVFRLAPPPVFQNRTEMIRQAGGFAPTVWRVAMNSGSRICVNGIDPHGHAIRPPTPDETPALKWLAYGSSITHSSLDGYPHVAAGLLRAQVLNKGLSGSCQYEPELVDWLIDDCDWELATLEMGVNMLGFFTPEQFEVRAAYAIKRFAGTGKPVLVTDIFPHRQTMDYNTRPDDITSQRDQAFRKIVRRLVDECGAPYLRMVPGAVILDDFTGLSADLLHPSAFGHAIMGANLAREIRKMPGIITTDNGAKAKRLEDTAPRVNIAD